MPNFNKIQFFFAKNNEDKDIVNKEMLRSNLNNIFIASAFGIPISLVHILLFTIQNTNESTKSILWHQGIIKCHSVLLCSFIIIFTYTLFARKSRSVPIFFSRFIIWLFSLSVLIIVSFITTYDQLVVQAITPFVIVSVLISAVVIQPPYLSALLLIINYTVFYSIISWFRSEPDILLTTLINAFTASAVSFIIFLIVYYIGQIRYKQARLISTQQLSLEESNLQLQAWSNELTKANETKDRFLHIIGHDLRGPMNLLVALSEQLEDSVKNDHKQEARYESEQIHRTAQLTRKLVEDLLNWAITQSGSLQVNEKQLSLSHLIFELSETFQSQLMDKQIKLNTNNVQDVFIVSDEQMLKTIFRNLIGNSLKFTPTNGEINISYEKLDERWHQIVIKDTGIGIRPEIIDRIFDITKRVSTKGLNNEKGSGLGLILCHEMLKRLGGNIRVESELGKGSRFYILIPV